jgi:hypothetical protein
VLVVLLALWFARSRAQHKRLDTAGASVEQEPVSIP